MGFLDRLTGGAQEDPAAREDAERLERGGIPRAAERRITELARPGGAFTSGFSTGDLVLSRLDGIRPVCQVMGSSVYQVGFQALPWSSGWSGTAALTELTQLTEAWNEARSRAFARLEQEARLAGCHAVVDVTVDARRHEFLGDEIEVVVQGTAVRLPDGNGGERPVLSDLSLPESVLLHRAGHRPVGIVAATSVWYVRPSLRTQQLGSGLGRFQGNQELPEYTAALYSARESAIARATQDAAALSADGLVGVSIEQQVGHREVERNEQKRIDMIVTFHVLGTAIVAAGEQRPLDVQTVVRQGAR